MIEYFVDGAGLNHTSILHHRHAVGNIRDYPEIMGDEQHPSFVNSLHIADQFQDLCLCCDIKRGCGFIGNQNFRFKRQRHSNHCALALAT